jgi:hypothetical protein
VALEIVRARTSVVTVLLGLLARTIIFAWVGQTLVEVFVTTEIEKIIITIDVEDLDGPFKDRTQINCSMDIILQDQS